MVGHIGLKSRNSTPLARVIVLVCADGFSLFTKSDRTMKKSILLSFTNEAMIQQLGTTSTALINQNTSSSNLGFIEQGTSGTTNQATINQLISSAGNSATITQNLTTSGTGNIAVITQGYTNLLSGFSNDNVATITQEGSTNQARLLQLRNNNTATFTQTGIGNIIQGLPGSADPTTARQETTSGIVGNTATINQTANAGFNISQLGQVGIGNTVLINQSGM